MKTKEELNALKNEIKSLNEKLSELNEDELKSVFGGREDNLRLKDTDDQTNTWNGLENPEHVFEPGSRFWIRSDFDSPQL